MAPISQQAQAGRLASVHEPIQMARVRARAPVAGTVVSFMAAALAVTAAALSSRVSVRQRIPAPAFSPRLGYVAETAANDVVRD